MILTDARCTSLGAQPPPGIYVNVPIADYFAWTYMSKSGLSDFAKSPALWYGRQIGDIPWKKSASFELGSAVDHLWVERLTFEPEHGYQVIPKINPLTEKPLPKTGKARTEYLEHLEAQGLTPISPSVVKKARAMQEALDANDRAQRLHAGAMAQVSIVWRCPFTGLMLKGRPDLVDTERLILSDLKSTKEIRPWAFDSDASAYNYHWQLYLYTQGLVANGVGTWADWSHWLITVRNSKPYGVACRPVPADALELAADETLYHLQRWIECARTKHFPADLLEEKPIELPRWRFGFTGRREV